jgi:hypothetical protein
MDTAKVVSLDQHRCARCVYKGYFSRTITELHLVLTVMKHENEKKATGTSSVSLLASDLDSQSDE